MPVPTEVDDAEGGAGSSAEWQADEFETLAADVAAHIESLTDALRSLRRNGAAFRRGAEGERQVAAAARQVIVDLGSSDWTLLADRHWPGTRQANIDLILVGPPGVLVLDAKAWRDVRVDGGRLWRGQADAQDDLDRLVAQRRAVADAVAEGGIASAAVCAAIVLVGRQDPPVALGGVTIVGERALSRYLVSMGPRLTPERISLAAGIVDAACPPAAPRARKRRESTSRRTPDDGQLAAWSADEIIGAAVDAAARGPIEAWMTWLHPAQNRAVTRSFSGPARLRGASGTGKSVVALHRARHLALQPGAHVLVTSFVRTLPVVQQGLFQRLAPELTDRVEFLGIHRWALRFLSTRRDVPRLVDGVGEFRAVWQSRGRLGPLGESRLPPSYWKEEVQSVIKGRGLTDASEYAVLDRIGRRTGLQEEQRKAVWELYEDYQEALAATEHWDWDDLLAHTLEEVRTHPPEPAYSAVIVDEVQDLTCVGMQLVSELAGSSPDALFLVGDGQQRVYPGGFSLAEAGVSVVGRSIVLDRNYRNGRAILRRALDEIERDEFEDLDVGRMTRDSVESVRQGGKVAEVLSPDIASLGVALAEVLRWDVSHGSRPGDLAVLVRTNREVGAWAARLRAHGIQTSALTDYVGTPTDTVKIGTYARAKGLEFEAVYLPDFDRARHSFDAAPDDQSALARSQLFVAMTRARDRLWLGSAGHPRRIW